MEQKTVGAQTRRLRTCPSVLSFAAVGGRFEGEGPLREYFDELSEDHFFGEKTWEKGESAIFGNLTVLITSKFIPSNVNSP